MENNVLDEFLRLMEKPLPEPPDMWWFELRHRCDLPWARLLVAQPQFEKYVHWKSVSRLELLKLGYMAPEIFSRHFPNANPWNLYPFLTPLEKSCLLCDFPEFENRVDWNELERQWSFGEWFILLSSQPQFEKYFDWRSIEKKPSPYWEMLLKKQPQFACHCDLEHLKKWQLKKIRKHQPQLFNEVNA